MSKELNLTFLRDIIPTDGFTAFVIPDKKTGYFDHSWVNLTTDATYNRIIKHHAEDTVFFAYASFNKAKRQVETAKHCRVLVLDIDAGIKKQKTSPDLSYKDYAEAEAVVKGWFRAASEELADEGICFTRPTWWIKSGEGIHLYWVCDDLMEPEQWYIMKDALHNSAEKYGLKFDTRVTHINALLRYPGSTHQGSEENPVKSEVVIDELSSTQKRYSLAELQAAFPQTGAAALPKQSTRRKRVVVPGGEKPDFLKSASDDWYKVIRETSKEFRSIVTSSIDGDASGCAFIAHCYQNQERIPEPVWFSMISILAACEDGYDLVHDMSSKHPNYTKSETDYKFNRAVESDCPHGCATIREAMRLNKQPDVCSECPHAGGNPPLKSPLLLATTKVNGVISHSEYRKKKAPERIGIDSEIPAFKKLAQQLDTVAQDEIFMPDGYFIDKKNGALIWNTPKDENVFVSAFPFYVTHRYYHGDKGDIIGMASNSPRNGIREFCLEQSLVTNSTKTLEILSKFGVIYAGKEQKDNILLYVRRSVQAMQFRESVPQRSHCGWQKDTDSYLHGNYEFFPDGKVTRAKIPGSEKFQAAQQPPQTALPSAWMAVAKHFMIPGMEPVMFILGVGLGAPLFHLLNVAGCLVHALSGASARSKSTACRLFQVGFGREEGVNNEDCGLKAKGSDSHHALFSRLAMLHSVPMYIDELSDKEPEVIKTLLYNTTQGKDRSRAMPDAQGLRDNTGAWRMAVVSNGNTSLTDTIVEHCGEMGSALLARLIEVDFSNVPNIDTDQYPLDDLLTDLENNHPGIVGQIIVSYIVTNQDKVKSMLEQGSEDLRSLNLEKANRFHKATLTCALVGLRIAREIGLIDYDEPAYLRFYQNLVKQSRDNMTEVSHEAQDEIRQFLTEHQAHGMIVKTINQGVSDHEIPKTNPCWLYIEETKEMRINIRLLRSWCLKRKISYAKVRDWFKGRGSQEKTTRLLPDRVLRESNVKCLVIPDYDLTSENNF